MTTVVTLIAVKREVAACKSRCSVERMSSYETGDKSLYKMNSPLSVDTTCESLTRTHTEKCTVTACRTQKVRKGGDFFYGKSSNANHIEGL